MLHDLTQQVENEHLYDALEKLNSELEERIAAATSDLAQQNERLLWQSEELAKANKLKSAFLANMSHELRTPLNAVEVSDTGVGIKPDEIDAIWEDFRQLDQSRTRSFGGTGLGLRITRRLTQQLGGQVSVTSVYGQGTTFTVRLPLVMAGLESAARS